MCHRFSGIGDSQMARFLHTCNLTDDQQHHLVISGATTNNIVQLLRRRVNDLHTTCLLMVGTNDVRLRQYNRFQDNFKTIVNFLTAANKVIFLFTIPPNIFKPFLNRDISKLNFFIKSFNTKPNVKIMDLDKIFHNSNWSELIEHYYFNNKVDGIHLNQSAHKVIFQRMKHELSGEQRTSIRVNGQQRWQ